MDAHWEVTPQPRLYEAWQVEERVSTAVAEERQRLAAELHDSLGGTLAAVAMGLAALQGSAFDEEGREKIATLADAIGQGLAEIRTLSFDLQLPWCELGTSFESALAQFATGSGRRTGLNVTIDMAASRGELTRGEALGLMRVLQEALLNVHRHAKASSVCVSFVQCGQDAKLTVQDDGCGMKMIEGIPPNGAGLVAMRDRIEGLGGAVQMDSGPAGTTISACIPCRCFAT